MYETYYGFKEKPFTTLPDPDFLYMSKKHEMALTYLEYGISSLAGFMVLTGEIGSGKTTLLNYLLKKIDDHSTNIALVFNTSFNPVEFLESILREWGVACKNAGKAELYDILNTFLISEYEKKRRVILIIDEAQNLPFETLEEVRMLSNLNDEKRPLLHIILSGQPSLKNRLNTPQMEQLRQRVSVHYHLDPLDTEEAFNYIESRLAKVGGQDHSIFTPEAQEKIYACSRGVPRLINLVCDLALVYGYAEQIKPINDSIIEMVVEDRKSMGLGMGDGLDLSDGSDDAFFSHEPENIVRLEKKMRELKENVYDLALLVRKMIKIKDYVGLHQREIKELREKIKTMEEKFSSSVYQEMFLNIIREWENANAHKENKH